MFLLALVLGLLGPTAAQYSPPVAVSLQDTALYTFRTPTVVFQQHRDTIWITAATWKTRVIDIGTDIFIRQERTPGTVTETHWIVRGDSAIRAHAPSMAALPVYRLRDYQRQISDAKRVERIIGRTPN
jgi:hypothetical protein